jgi:hypothetical protein
MRWSIAASARLRPISSATVFIADRARPSMTASQKGTSQ